MSKERLNERNKVLDILDKMIFFQGQRAGRELWNDKPKNIQEEDLDNFNKDVRAIRDYIWDLEKELKQYRDLEEQGLPLRLPCKVGDTVWELCKCDDDVYRIFPMTVKQVAQYGSIRWVKGKEPTAWNIYATSDYTYMYKSFYDIGRTVFLTKSEAEEKLRELEEAKCQN